MSPESTFDRQSSSHNAFVGRERELAELRAGLDDVSAGRGRLFLLSGEPGIGKTRLVEEISRDAAARGMRVVWGRCWEGGGAPAYWPFIQILRACVEGVDAEHLKALLGSGASEIARLIPEIKLALPSLEEAKRVTGSESAQFLLFDAVATLLKNVARTGPLLIVIDDLHDADQPSLQILRFVARAAKDVPLLLIGTYRDAEVRQSPELGKLIGDLIREGRTVSVAGLSKTEVGEFVERSSAKEADEKLISDLHHATAGNPLFVDGVVRLLAAEGKHGRTGFDASGFKIPDGVRESIRRRLAALSDEARSLLSIASVIGNEFDLRLLDRVSTRSAEQIIEQTDEGLRIGVLRTGGAGFQRQQFAHALIRAVLYDDLATNRRIELHREIGAAIEEIHKDDPRPYLAALAHHFQEAGNSNKAINYLSRAGDEARRVYAYEEAVSRWSAALELVEEFGGYRRLYADLHHKLAETMGGQGERSGRREHLEEALRMYQELGDADKTAQLDLHLGNDLSVVGLARVEDLPRAADHLRRAEAVLSKGPENPNLVLLYLIIGNLAARTCRVRDAVVALRHSMEIAERIGNSEFWTFPAGCLTSILPQIGKIGEALKVQAQVWSKLDTLNTHGTAFAAVMGAGHCLMELWDPRGAQKWWATEVAKSRLGKGQRKVFIRALQVAYLLAGDSPGARRLLAQGAHPSAAGMLAFYEGEWELADSILEQGLERARSASPEDRIFYGQALARVRSVRGEPARAETLLRDALLLYPEEEPHCQAEMVIRPELALVYLEMGRLEDAVAEVSRCREVSAGEDWRGLGGHLARADAAVAAETGKLDEALAGFETAVTIFRKYALPWEEADTLHRWGRAMSAAGAPDRAIENFDAAIDIYHRHGAGTRFVEYVMADRMRVQGSKSTQDDDHVPLTDSIHGVAAAVAQERADLARHAAPDGTVSILFTDIENSTAMFEKLGDLRAQEILHQHNAIIREQLAAHQGFEVKSMGDGFMLAFSSARRALLCAIAIQRAFEAWSEKHPEDPIRVRIGVHTGEAIKEAGDFYGKTVILASRIAAEANGGEILVSSTLKEIVDNAGDLRFEESRDVELQGFAGQHRIHRAQWYETETSAVTVQTECIFRREGDYWTIAYDGKTARLKDAKGFHYIAYLLGHPGQEIRALDLVARIGGGGEETVEKASAEDLARSDSVAGDLGNAGEMLDAQAKAAYQRRLTELEDELEEARELGNEARAEKAEDEIVALGRELKGAIGLAGRDRRAASSTERARIAVTKAIRLSLNKIAENDASLGKLLSTTIKTGTVCAYVPDDRFPVTWRL